MPRTSLRVSGRTRPSISPRQPFRMPTHSPPPPTIRATTPRMAAFSPGQSPPAVSTPTFTAAPSSYLGCRWVFLQAPRGGNHEHRHRGSAHDAFGHTPEAPTRGAGAAVGGHHDHVDVGLVRPVDDRRRRVVAWQQVGFRRNAHGAGAATEVELEYIDGLLSLD